jgi:hypothetical protein
MRRSGDASVKIWVASIAAGAALIVGAAPMYLPERLPFWDAWLSFWVILFVVSFALTALEGVFFMKSPEIHRASQFVVAFLATSAIAAVSAILFGSRTVEFTLADKCRALFAEQSVTEWIIRFIGSAGLFAFLYAVVGSATWPFVREYYQNPDHALGLRVPRARVIIPLQIVRGLCTTLSLVPLIAVIPAVDAVWWFRLYALLVVVMGVGPLLLATRWPARLRFLHAVEFTVFTVGYSFVVWWLIARPAAS